jgi:hypothetical protein
MRYGLLGRLSRGVNLDIGLSAPCRAGQRQVFGAAVLFAPSRWEELPDDVRAMCAELTARCKLACGTRVLDEPAQRSCQPYGRAISRPLGKRPVPGPVGHRPLP